LAVNEDTSSARQRTLVAAEKIGAGDIEGGLKTFFEGIYGEGTWVQAPEAVKQERRDNARTLLGQLNEQRQPYRRAEAAAISVLPGRSTDTFPAPFSFRLFSWNFRDCLLCKALRQSAAVRCALGHKRSLLPHRISLRIRPT
jgi:hypothetical protein